MLLLISSPGPLLHPGMAQYCLALYAQFFFKCKPDKLLKTSILVALRIYKVLLHEQHVNPLCSISVVLTSPLR